MSRLFVHQPSGRRESNPRPSAWKADALPIELLPQKLLKRYSLTKTLPNDPYIGGGRRVRTSAGRSPADLQSAPFGHSGIPPKPHRGATRRESWRWDLNPQPPDYKSGALPIELRQPYRPLSSLTRHSDWRSCFQTSAARAKYRSLPTTAREASGMYRSVIW